MKTRLCALALSALALTRCAPSTTQPPSRVLDSCMTTVQTGVTTIRAFAAALTPPSGPQPAWRKQTDGTWSLDLPSQTDKQGKPHAIDINFITRTTTDPRCPNGYETLANTIYLDGQETSAPEGVGLLMLLETRLAHPEAASNGEAAAANQSSSAPTQSGAEAADNTPEPPFDWDAVKPAFGAYPSQAFAGPLVKPDFSGRDADYREYRTVLGDAAAEGVNFGGRYHVAQVGCGTGCRAVYIIDEATGRIFDFPLGGEENANLDLKFEAGSLLLKAHWDVDAPGGGQVCVRAAYLWSDDHATLLHQDTVPGECGV